MVKIKDLLDMINEESTKQKEKAAKAKKFAVGITVIGIAGAAACIMMTTRKVVEMRGKYKGKALESVEYAKNTVQNSARDVDTAADNAAKAANSVIHDISKKTDDLSEDVKSGYQNIKNDVNKTADNISNDLKKDGK
jgi:gas vesicle protein